MAANLVGIGMGNQKFRPEVLVVVADVTRRRLRSWLSSLSIRKKSEIIKSTNDNERYLSTKKEDSIICNTDTVSRRYPLRGRQSQ